MTIGGLPHTSHPQPARHGTDISGHLALSWLLEQTAEDRWAVSEPELCILLGIRAEQLALWRSAEPDAPLILPGDILERIGCLFRLDCILSIVMPATHRFNIFSQPSAPDSFFAGLSIKDYLLASPRTPRFYLVCNYLQGHVVLGRPLAFKSPG